MIRVAILTSDAREHYKDYDTPIPYFGTAPEALLQGLASQPGVEVHVVSALQKRIVSPDKIAPNIWYHGLHVPKYGWLRTGYQGCVRAVRRKLKSIRPDLVHGQGTERDCAICALWSGFPNVITIHGNMSEMARVFKARIGSFAWCAGLLENHVLRRTSGVLCNSQHTEEMVRPYAAKVWRVPNAVREAFFSRPRPGRTRSGVTSPVLLNVGVVCANKRQIELLDLAGRLHAKGRQFVLRFLGLAEPSNPYAAEFLARLEVAKKRGYASHEGVSTEVGKVIDFFDQGDALIHFPKVEAFGLVVAEALARGLKLFGARCGGIVDIAQGVDGAELFDPDDIAALEAGVSDWIEGGTSTSTNASALMREQYHPGIIAGRHLEIYREVLNTVSSAASGSCR